MPTKKEAKPAQKQTISCVYALRTSAKDGSSYNGFKWPTKGRVEAPDWDPAPHCGNGLHGLLWGQGDGSLLNWDPDAKWIVVKIEGDHVDLGGKVKFRACEIVYCGERHKATQKMGELAQAAGVLTAIVAGTATAGNWGTATAGDEGTATAGCKGTATAGDEGLLQILYLDSEREKYRFKRRFVGEGGLKPNTPYRLDENAEFVEVEKKEKTSV